MSLRDQLEAKKAAALAQEQAVQEQFKAEAQKQIGENIASLYGEQQKLTSLLVRINEITSTEQKVATTRNAMKEKGNVLREIHKESVEDETIEAFPTPVAMLQSEDFQEVSEITGYKQSKDEHRQALRERKTLRDELEALGIDDTSSPEAITKDVKNALAEKKNALRTLVRENPEVQTPEALEVRGEMVQERENKMLQRVENTQVIIAAQGSIQRALQNLEQNRWFKDGEPNVERIDQFKSRGAGAITRSILNELAVTQGFNNFVASLKVEKQNSDGVDDVDIEALKGALKKIIFNYTVERNGKFTVLDAIGTNRETKRALSKSYEAIHGVSLDEYMHSDKSGYKLEVGPVVENLLDNDILEKFSKKILEVATLQGKLDSWDDTVKSKERVLSGLREQVDREDGKIRDAQNGIDHEQRQIQSAVTAKDKDLRTLEGMAQIGGEDKSLTVSVQPKTYHLDNSLRFPEIDILETEARTEHARLEGELYRDQIAEKRSAIALIDAEPETTGIIFKKPDHEKIRSKNRRSGLLAAEIEQLDRDRVREGNAWYEKDTKERIYGRKARLEKIFEGRDYWLKEQGSFQGTFGELLASYEKKIKEYISLNETSISEHEGKLLEFQATKGAAETEKERLIEEVNTLFHEISDNYNRESKNRLIDRIASHWKQITT